MDHVDLIIMGGYFGEGRRKGISHFLVGAAVPPAAEGNVCVSA
jgi:ATP-dependent DNA ligase